MSRSSLSGVGPAEERLFQLQSCDYRRRACLSKRRTLKSGKAEAAGWSSPEPVDLCTQVPIAEAAAFIEDVRLQVGCTQICEVGADAVPSWRLHAFRWYCRHEAILYQSQVSHRIALPVSQRRRSCAR